MLPLLLLQDQCDDGTQEAAGLQLLLADFDCWRQAGALPLLLQQQLPAARWLRGFISASPSCLPCSLLCVLAVSGVCRSCCSQHLTIASARMPWLLLLGSQLSPIPRCLVLLLLAMLTPLPLPAPISQAMPYNVD